MPEWADNEPLIHPGDEFFLSAFHLLNTGETRSTWSEIVLFADRHGIDKDFSDIFVSIIRELESVYFEFSSKKLKANLKKG